MTFNDFAAAHGLIIRHLTTGKITRCPTESKPHSVNGAFLYQGNWGWIYDWACHTEIQLWKDDNADPIIVAREMKESRDNHAKERDQAAHKAASKAQWILGQSYLDLHAYAGSKGFADEMVNCWKPKEGELPLMVVPMFTDGKVTGCQLLDIDGSKKFLTGQRTKGSYFKISNESVPDKIFLVEGFATGKSLQVVLKTMNAKFTILVCFSAGNVKHMAAKHQKAKIIADHDKSGVGQAMAEATGLRFWLPPEPGDDFNDHWVKHGTLKCNLSLRKFVYCV